MIQYILLIFVGGGLGSTSRFLISEWALKIFGEKLPLGTLFSNFLASLILISTVAFFNNKFDSLPWIKPFILIGFCGGFSTFSTFSFETFLMFKSGHVNYAIINILFNVILCIGIMFFIYKK